MKNPLKHLIKDQSLWLSPERCIFWEEQNALIVSDLHIGKTGHFRKYGIAIPQQVFKEDIQRLICQIQFFKAEKLIVVGDLFHSYANKELELFLKWRNDLPGLEILLVKGNHDILKKNWYMEAGIHVFDDCLTINPFFFVHDIKSCKKKDEDLYFFTGHIHPGISITGAGKQSLKFACFYFGDHYSVLPAFSKFTGLAMIEPKKHESVFAIVENNVIEC